MLDEVREHLASFNVVAYTRKQTPTNKQTQSVFHAQFNCLTQFPEFHGEIKGQSKTLSSSQHEIYGEPVRYPEFIVDQSFTKTRKPHQFILT